MGQARASNKDILDALDTGFDRLITALTANAVSAAPAIADEGSITPEGTVKIDEAYLEHMTLKAAEHATNKGEETVLYARRNKAGETKLAYALRGRFDDVVDKQASCKGAVATFQP